MKVLRFELQNSAHTGVIQNGDVIPIEEVNAKRGSRVPADVLGIIEQNDLEPLRDLRGIDGIPLGDVRPLLPYEKPPKIWCIGLNYRTHADDINAVQPEEPGSFMKPASCMLQPSGEIVLPPVEISNDVDAEGELGIIIGKRAKGISAADVPGVIFGFTTTLDLTALDVLARNPRYLTRAKSIDTFFSFGPVVVTADEVADIPALEVVTEHNSSVCSRDYVRNMKTGPLDLIAFHS